MINKDYIINMEGINTNSDIKTSKDNLVNQSNQPDASISEGVNFKVSAGFEHVSPTLPFSASLSSDIIDFGTLSPTNPIIRTIDLAISYPYRYSVIAFEDHPLKNGQAFIPDTTCDNGICSQENSSEWINTLTYGFGYRCDNTNGNDCNKSFSNPNFYKHFSDNSNEQSPQTIMSGTNSKNNSARLSYKVNISGNQAKINYSNTITYLAIPNF